MTKIFSTTISLVVAMAGIAAVATPAQAATRLMSSTVDAFEYRCERHDGIFSAAGQSVSCQTPTVAVSCDYFDVRQAVCAWPGIENQIAVIRVIGTIPAGYTASLSSDDDSAIADAPGNGGGGGGGFMGPKDIQDAPNNDPKPNWDGPKDFQMAP
ncbi:hypothetical protein ASD83_05230 [Devosia sp. Root685]|uniref:hypothetical protein n=1 Tax=Devosia sp. Root685 TaxID=1736587 RepID=UPI0006F88A4F|nr:hypothetical protein [Devosia sp. Root685]KRA99891.1 hypothetical protein ASD83_05230 [Devosia sp. Root685]